MDAKKTVQYQHLVYTTREPPKMVQFDWLIEISTSGYCLCA